MIGRHFVELSPLLVFNQPGLDSLDLPLDYREKLVPRPAFFVKDRILRRPCHIIAHRRRKNACQISRVRIQPCLELRMRDHFVVSEFPSEL
jgi:hypothetical protein